MDNPEFLTLVRADAYRMLRTLRPDFVQDEIDTLCRRFGLVSTIDPQRLHDLALTARATLTDKSVDEFLAAFVVRPETSLSPSKKIRKVALELAGGLEQKLPSISFAGDVEFFHDKGAWHVSLAGGGLAHSLRLEPRKDSPTAEALALLVLTQHIQQSLTAVSKIVEKSSERGSTCVLKAEAGAIFVILSAHRPHDDSLRLNAVIMPDSKHSLNVQLSKTEGFADEELRDDLVRVVTSLISHVPEFKGMGYGIVGFTSRATRQLITVLEQTPRGALSIRIEEGQRIGQGAQTVMAPSGAWMHQALVVLDNPLSLPDVHPDGAVVIGRGEPTNDYAVPLSKVLGVPAEQVRTIQTTQTIFDDLSQLDYDEVSQVGFLSIEHDEEIGDDRDSAGGMGVMRYSITDQGMSVEVAMGQIFGSQMRLGRCVLALANRLAEDRGRTLLGVQYR